MDENERKFKISLVFLGIVFFVVNIFVPIDSLTIAGLVYLILFMLCVLIYAIRYVALVPPRHIKEKDGYHDAIARWLSIQSREYSSLEDAELAYHDHLEELRGKAYVLDKENEWENIKNTAAKYRSKAKMGKESQTEIQQYRVQPAEEKAD